MRRHLTVPAALVVVGALLLSACAGDDRPSGATVDGPSTAPGDRTPATSELEGTITVSAASSLTDAFTRIGDDFMAEHPRVEVRFNLDSSSVLATQITDGAPADVFASADEANMVRLTDRALIAGRPVTFARNELVIVTQPGNPEGVTDLADLADAGVVSLCAEAAPCGRYAAQVLADAGVSLPESDVTRGQNVSATLTAVTDGDAVAGIVYASDAVRAGDSVDAIPIPASQNAVAVYPIGVVASTGNPEAAEAFLAEVLSPQGQEVLAESGFLPAP